MKKALPFLAVAFSGFLVYLFDKIWGNSINWEKVKSVKIGDWISTEFSFRIYEVLLFIILVSIIYFLGKKYINKDSYYSKKQKKLRQFNNIIDNKTNILFRWGVYFDYDKPFISDLDAFCTKHEGPPLRFVGRNCPIRDCDNHRINIDEYMVKNHIESDLIDRWEKMK
jgi:hypothetical protein